MSFAIGLSISTLRKVREGKNPQNKCNLPFFEGLSRPLAVYRLPHSTGLKKTHAEATVHGANSPSGRPCLPNLELCFQKKSGFRQFVEPEHAPPWAEEDTNLQKACTNKQMTVTKLKHALMEACFHCKVTIKNIPSEYFRGFFITRFESFRLPALRTVIIIAKCHIHPTFGLGD